MVIGFSIAAPVGPIGTLCIRRSLHDGGRAGLAVGLGAATADAAYGCIAAFGLTAVSTFLVGQRFCLGLLGGIFLCYLGIMTFVRKPAATAAKAKEGGLLTTYISALFLTLTNPMTILSFVAVFAGFGLGATPDFKTAGLLVFGVFLGSTAWWILLSSGVGLLRSRLSSGWLQNINRICGVVLIAFGMYALIAGISPR